MIFCWKLARWKPALVWKSSPAVWACTVLSQHGPLGKICLCTTARWCIHANFQIKVGSCSQVILCLYRRLAQGCNGSPKVGSCLHEICVGKGSKGLVRVWNNSSGLKLPNPALSGSPRGCARAIERPGAGQGGMQLPAVCSVRASPCFMAQIKLSQIKFRHNLGDRTSQALFSRGYLDAVTQGFLLGGRVRHVDVSQAAPLGLGARAEGSPVWFSAGEVLYGCFHVSGLQL